MREDDRLLLLNAVRLLVDDARAERALLDCDADERSFLLGVDAAAQEVLHPALGDSRADGWLAREPVPFRDGYLRTQALLAAARAEPRPSRLPVPRLRPART